MAEGPLGTAPGGLVDGALAARWPKLMFWSRRFFDAGVAVGLAAEGTEPDFTGLFGAAD